MHANPVWSQQTCVDERKRRAVPQLWPLGATAGLSGSFSFSYSAGVGTITFPSVSVRINLDGTFHSFLQRMNIHISKCIKDPSYDLEKS